MATLSREEALTELAKVLSRPGQSIEGYDIQLPSYVTPESLAEFAKLPLEPSDVFIVTYPKSGTTWTQNIVKHIRSSGVKDGEELLCSVPWIEGNSDKNVVKVDLASMPRPRAFKSHMTYDTMPCGRPCTTPSKYIYVARNPKDVAVSYYHHYTRGVVREDATLEWDLFFRNFVYGNVWCGDVFDHVLSWWRHREDDNVLFLLFEDMKRDLPKAVARIAEFIGADILDEVIVKVVAETSFETMKEDDKANYSFMNECFTTGTTPFMRKGQVGDWKNYFTPEQSAEMDKMCRERLDGTGLLFDFGGSL